jgi:hypothetical protein
VFNWSATTFSGLVVPPLGLIQQPNQAPSLPFQICQLNQVFHNVVQVSYHFHNHFKSFFSLAPHHVTRINAYAELITPSVGVSATTQYHGKKASCLFALFLLALLLVGCKFLES